MLLRQVSNLYHSLNRRALYQLSYKGLVLLLRLERKLDGSKPSVLPIRRVENLGDGRDLNSYSSGSQPDVLADSTTNTNVPHVELESTILPYESSV